MWSDVYITHGGWYRKKYLLKVWLLDLNDFQQRIVFYNCPFNQIRINFCDSLFNIYTNQYFCSKFLALNQKDVNFNQCRATNKKWISFYNQMQYRILTRITSYAAF